MDAWVLWLIGAAVAGVGEMLTTGFFLAPFAVGALAGVLFALAGVGAGVQFMAFAAATIAIFALVRPVARRHLYTPPQIRTGTAALVGAPAVVLQRIDNDANAGQVRINSDVWTARAYDDDQVLEPGARVVVVEIRGATALVAP